MAAPQQSTVAAKQVAAAEDQQAGAVKRVHRCRQLGAAPLSDSAQRMHTQLDAAPAGHRNFKRQAKHQLPQPTEHQWDCPAAAAAAATAPTGQRVHAPRQHVDQDGAGDHEGLQGGGGGSGTTDTAPG